jgi:hypothetical protein
MYQKLLPGYKKLPWKEKKAGYYKLILDFFADLTIN